MKNTNVGVLGYSDKFKKFLGYLNNKNTIYNLKFLIKQDKPNIENILNKYCENYKIKFLILCDDEFKELITKNIQFFIKKKIIIVKAANNYEIDNHGFIIQKLFKDFSFEDIFLRKTLKINIKETANNLKNKKILITGGGGSIGCNLILNILKFKIKKIFIIDNNEYALFRLTNLIPNIHNKKIQIKIINIENKKMLDKFVKFANPDIIFHTAALKHVQYLEKNPTQAIMTNTIGTQNTLEAANKYKVKHFIHVSTDKAANPKNNLGVTKKISENICANYTNHKIKIGIVRFGNVFDSNGSVSEIFRNKILNQEKIKITNINVKRFFMSKDEASNLLLHVSNHLHDKKVKDKVRTFIYNMGKPIKILDLAKKMIFLSGRQSKKYIEKKYSGLLAVEKIVEQLMSKNETIKKIDANNILEITTNKFINKISNSTNILKIINKNNDDFANQYLKKMIKLINK